MIKEDNLKILNNPVSLLASCCGIGMSPIAPATMGSLFAMLCFYLTLDFGENIQTIIFFVLIISGFWICDKSAKALNHHDHSSIVWDEASVMYGILLFIDFLPIDWVIAFLLFRFFDIFKPWPISYVDKKIGGGLGIMLDDILAGLATVITYEVVKLFF